MSEVVVKLGSGAKPETVLARAAVLDLALEPLHPHTGDAELESYYVGHIDDAAAQGVAERLMHCEGVEGAFVKPAGAPP